MKIILRMNGINYDITPIVDTVNLKKEIEIELSTEGTFNTASFIIPSVTQYQLGPDIDLSRGLIRNSLVTIERDGISYQWRIMGDSIVDNQNDTFSHTVQLIDRRSETTGINLPGLTLTQRKGFIDTKYRSAHIVPENDPVANGMYSRESLVPYISEYDYIPERSRWNNSSGTELTEYSGNDILFKKQARDVNVSDEFLTSGSADEVSILADAFKVPLPTKVKNIKDTTFLETEETISSLAPSVLDGRILKIPNQKYYINFSCKVANTQNNIKYDGWIYDFEYSNADIIYAIEVYANNDLIYTTNTKTLAANTGKAQAGTGAPFISEIYPSTDTVNIYFEYTPTTIDEEIKIKVVNNSPNYRVSSNQWEQDLTYKGIVTLSDINLSINTPSSGLEASKTLEDWINRGLNNIFIDEEPPYELSDNSAARLRNISAPEFTIKQYNLHQLLQEVADFLGTSWQITNDDKIDFIFFDDTIVQDIAPFDKQSLTASSDLNDYASSIQLNVENVASSSVKKENNLSVRAIDEGNARITTDNLMIKTERPINYINKVIFKGIPLEIDGETIDIDWDITDRVVTKEEWDILPSNFDDTQFVDGVGRKSKMKNNTIYFIRGQKGLYGLSYVGGAEPNFFTDPTVNRAFFEAIAATAHESINIDGQTNGDVTTIDGGTVNSGIQTQNNLRVDIEYYPFTSSSVHIYKDDQSGFQLERHKYFNESARVNDPELIGKVSQNNVNRLGGTEYTITGYIETLAQVPKLGTLNSDNRRLTKIILQFTDTYIRYTATYIADYTKISKFVGKKSDYRLYEIPNTAVIESNRIKRNRIILGSLTPGPSMYSLSLKTLANIKEDCPVLARLHFNHSDGTSTVYSTVSPNDFGRTGSWKITLPNNFSAGVKKISRTISGEIVWFQEEVPYTDSLGTTDAVTIRYYSDYNSNDSYPSAIGSGTILIDDQLYDYSKDAREIFSFENEISFGTNDIDKYRIYDGLTKYNSFLTGNTSYEVVCRVLDYIPNRSDIKVDLNKTKSVANIDVQSDKIVVTSYTFGKGLVFYEKNTEDILLVVKDLNFAGGLYEIPFGMKEEIVLRTVEFNTNGGSFVPDQVIADGSTLIEPVTTRTGFNFDGWYTESSFINQFNFSTPITTDLVLYAKWVSIVNHSWVSTSSTTSDSGIYPRVESFQCPINYSSYLPDANGYDLNHILSVTPVRNCNTGTEICMIYSDGEEVALCPSQYFKVV